MSELIRQRAQGARQASQVLAISTEATRNAALDAIATALETRRDEILAANQKDIEAAEAMVEEGKLDAPLLKRLNLGGAKFAATVEMVHSVRAQLDPLGQTQSAIELDSGLDLYRVSVPIGVIGVIFESRPDALVQIACICLKSGNAVLLKGGREAAASNRILAQIIDAATAAIDGIPPGWLTLLETREDVGAILDLDHDIDLIIPRGGNEFVQYIMSHTNIPVMGHADGICHVYIDATADLDKAVRIAVDSKTQYVSVCNAAETLLVHQDIAAAFLDRALPALEKEKVELRGDGRTRSLAGNNGRVIAATQEDWSTEYLDYILSIKVVDNLEEAIAHINTYSSHHTDAIVSEDTNAAQQFLRSVDSASVLHNASTRFADGFRYGLGAEVGISTNRLHSRGPVGLEGLTIYKYILQGDGHTVADFEGDTPKTYTHRPLDKAWRSS
jgi:glutamate-5-semialdehyde dehydrogenase